MDKVLIGNLTKIYPEKSGPRVRPPHRFEVNQRIKVTFDLDHAHRVDPASGQVLK